MALIQPNLQIINKPYVMSHQPNFNHQPWVFFTIPQSRPKKNETLIMTIWSNPTFCGEWNI